MEMLICIAGLPREVVFEVKARPPAKFTDGKTNFPIIKKMAEPFSYRSGMSDYFLIQLANRLEHIPPEREVGIGLAYAKHSGGIKSFLNDFFPFAATIEFDPVYPGLWLKHEQRTKMTQATENLIGVVEQLRQRMKLIRDSLSGQKFSPLTLPLRNFRSDVLNERIFEIYQELGQHADPRTLVSGGTAAILARHPLHRQEDHRPFFTDSRGLRFKSPGGANHGVARVVGTGHISACLINGRTRLGGPLKSGFHYDCEYERAQLDITYPNCHGDDQAPSKSTHVNIAPSDAIR